MPKAITSIFISIIFVSCNSNTENNKEQNVVIEEWIPPILSEYNPKYGTPFETSWLPTSQYELLYIGSEKDTVAVDHLLSAKFYHGIPLEWFKNPDSIPKLEYADYYLDWMDTTHNTITVEFADLKILVDTSQKVSGYRACYPVFIKNNNKDTVLIAYGEMIHAVMEARDKKGEWQPIEEPWGWMCGTGVGHVMLPPNEIVLTSAVKYTGEFKTEMRVKIAIHIQTHSTEASTRDNLKACSIVLANIRTSTKAS